MKSYLTKYLLIVILSAFASAQHKSVRLNHIDIEQGLSQNIVRDIIQDSKGFIWIATWDGLNRYDGYEFKVYKHIPGDSTSLRTNKIYRLLEDRSGRLWVGTFGGGLSLFNREEENFTNFLSTPNHKTSKGLNWIVSLYEDSQNRIWIGTQAAGVYLLKENRSETNKPETEKFKFINFRNEPETTTSLSDNGVFSICEDNSGIIWFGLNDGSLNKLIEATGFPEEYKFVKYSYETEGHSRGKSSFLSAIERDVVYPEIFWLSIEGKGLKWFNTKSGQFIIEIPELKLPKEIPQLQVEEILIGKDGTLWLATMNKGVYAFNRRYGNSSESFEHFYLDPFNAYSLDAPDISVLYEDKMGMIWIGTHSKGVYTHHRNTKRFTGYSNNPVTNNSLIDNTVFSVMEDKEGNLWIGTEQGLDKYNPVSGKFTHFRSNPNIKESISGDIIYSIHQDPEGTIWIGTEKSLNKYIPLTNSFIHYKNNPDDPESISKGEIIKLFSDSKGNLWIGSWGGGLNKLIRSHKTGENRFLNYRSDSNDPNSISDNRIMSIAEGPDFKLWIGTADGGLNLLVSDYSFTNDGKVIKPKFKGFQYEPGNSKSLSNNDVRTIYIDHKGILWLGTFGGGLNKLSPSKDKNEIVTIEHYRQSDGLANDVVRGILPDEEGNLWIGTANGLSKFNPTEKTFWNFDVPGGLQTAKFEDANYKSKKDRRLYFGGLGGVVSFLPSEIKTNPYIPPVVITSFTRYNENSLAMIDEKGITEKKKIILSHNDNILTFEFSALNFFSSSKNKYIYKLEGYNSTWIQLGNKRDVTFTNLDPGTYNLFVQGSNNDGVWNEAGTVLEIVITPPWWRTNWAFGAYVVMLIAGVLATDRVMRRRVIKKERDKAKLREAELIKNQADELETVDRLVRIINNAEDLDSLFNSLLKQTMNFIPQAEMAAVFLLDIKDNLFKVAFTAGYKLNELEKISFTREELQRRYASNSEEVEKGIYILSGTKNLYGDEKLSGLMKPNSMLVMAVERESTTEAYVVFDSFKKPFDKSAARFLNRFREHAVSAISKAQAIKILQDKNEEIIRTQEQLITQQKLASLGALTAGIAHEIKNPLNFVNNFSEVSRELLDEIKTELNNKNDDIAIQLIEDLKQNLDKINQHGKRADSIVKGMLLHSRGTSGEKTLTDINDLLDQYVNLAYHGMRATNKEFNITIEKDFDESLEKVNVVPQDISRVFLNTINNACYAAFDRKKKSSDNNFSPTLRVATKSMNHKVEIRIADNGNGIPDDHLDKIFNPFFTTKPTGEGTGLGLSLSYDIITKVHGGDIKVESEEGKGAMFIIELPLS